MTIMQEEITLGLQQLCGWLCIIVRQEKFLECFDFVVNSCTEHGFLAEQVNNNTLKSNWVIGLGWSHAMFVIVLNWLEKGLDE